MSIPGGRVAVACGGVSLALIALAGSAWMEQNVPTRRSRSGSGRFEVISGTSFRSIATDLADSGWVRLPRLLAYRAHRAGLDRKIRPGRYRFERGWAPRRVLEELIEGRVELTRATIPEGWRQVQVFRLLADSIGIAEEDLELLARQEEWNRSQGIPRASLEGYLFPETYDFEKGAPARTVLARMVSEASDRFNEAMRMRAEELGMTRDQIVTLASIVQAEAALPEEMPRIAAVYWNRLKRGYRLEADPTVLYALARMRGPVLYADLESESPYNTYRAYGLPPGPICNPGANAIRATLWPDSTRPGELYFVARGDGGHRFSKTLEEHNRARREIRARTKEH